MSAHALPLRARAAVLRRLARSSEVESLVLRGGLMMRLWSGPVPRPVEDLDFLSRFSFDAADTVKRLESVLRAGVEDGFSSGALKSEVIWAETAFPGVRSFVETRLPGVDGSFELRIDTGFGDPMDPGPAWTEYDVGEAAAARVLACRPETLLGWKMHGLFERERAASVPRSSSACTCSPGTRRWTWRWEGRPEALAEVVAAVVTALRPTWEAARAAQVRP